MAKEERVLAIDIGATSIKLCEFCYSNGNTVTLERFAHREYEEELSDSTRMGVVSGLLRQMLAEGGFQARKALVGMSGQASLTRFTRMPIINFDKKKIKQMAEFEATQNIPYKPEEVILDYQLIPTLTGDAVDLMSVVIRNEIVEQFTSAIGHVGCVPILIDVAPAACYNASKACGIGADECNVVLNIGGRVTNLIFLEGERMFARTIPIAGYTITQQIAKEFGIGLPEAEELKRHHGFVALGGAYAEPESETAANVSKIVRNVMARLQSEVARTINLYRAQQKGNKPVKMYITGGSSILTYCDIFFAEKLNIPVEYLNPFKCINLAPTIDRKHLQEVGHMFSEVIGLGLRYAMQCPIELTLIPPSIRKQQVFNNKKPFILMSAVALIVMLLVVWFGLDNKNATYSTLLNELTQIKRDKAERFINPIEEALGAAADHQGQIALYGDTLMSQALWPAILNEIYRLKPANLWFVSMTPIIGEVKPFEIASVTGAAMEGGFGDPMSGGSSMFGEGGGMFGGIGGEGAGNTGPSGAMATIGGLEIVGCSVMPDTKGVVYALGDEIKFPASFKIDKTGLEETGGQSDDESGENAESSSAGVKTLNEIILKAMKEGGTPELAFIAALRKSRMFDADETLTTITSFNPSDTVKNFSSFKIQVKFSFPVEFFQITTRASSAGKGGMMMGR